MLTIALSWLGSVWKRLEGFSNETLAPQLVVWQDVSMNLVQMRSDTSIRRISGEIGWSRAHGGKGDMYGLKRMSASRGIVIDIGANIGDFAISVAKLYPHIQIVALEPSPTTFLVLIQNLILNNVTILKSGDIRNRGPGGVLALNCVASERGMYIHWSDSNSMNAFASDTGLPQRHGQRLEGWKTKKVQSFNLTNFVKTKAIKRVEFLKMDCEGCEYDLIPRLSFHNWLSKDRVPFLSAELHAMYNDKLFWEFSKIEQTLKALSDRGCSNVRELRTELKC